MDIFDVLAEEEKRSSTEEPENNQQVQTQQKSDEKEEILGDFFDDVSITSKGNFIKKSDNSKPAGGEPEPILGKFKSQEDLVKAYQELEKKQSMDSEKLKELGVAEPLIQAMQQDPNLIQHVKNYFEQNSDSKEKFDLPEDFEFDIQEALSDENSESAKVLSKIVESRASKRVRDLQFENQRKSELAKQREESKKKFNLDDKALDDILKRNDSRRISVEDVVFLDRRDALLKAEYERGRQEVIEEIKKRGNSGLKTFSTEKKDDGTGSGIKKAGKGLIDELNSALIGPGIFNS